MRFRQPRCPECGSFPDRMAGHVPTMMDLSRTDESGVEQHDTDSSTAIEFRVTGSEPRWDEEVPERSPDGGVTLFCSNWQCRQALWCTDVLSDREVELEEAVRAYVHAKEEGNATQLEAVHDRLRELVAHGAPVPPDVTAGNTQQ